MIIDQDLIDFINETITSFHKSRLRSLESLQFNKVLARKNPYLFRAKNIVTAEEFVRCLIDAFLSSQEETIFGEFLERLAIYVCNKTRGGYKSGIEGIDLEINEGENRFIITVKSGPNWGNSSQIAKMKDNFNKAKRILRTQNSFINVIPINGCCYGKDKKPDKGEYLKFCGQKFWTFISGDSDIYREIIIPIGYSAKEKNEEFNEEYIKVINRFSKEFLISFCKEDGTIEWKKIVEYNSSEQ